MILRQVENSCSDGIKEGGIFPLEPLPPYAPSQKKKWSKSAIFGKFLDFSPLRNAFYPGASILLLFASNAGEQFFHFGEEFQGFFFFFFLVGIREKNSKEIRKKITNI